MCKHKRKHLPRIDCTYECMSNGLITEAQYKKSLHMKTEEAKRKIKTIRVTLKDNGFPNTGSFGYTKSWHR